jgi:long-chain acyl-CoA synthetase
MEQHIAQMLANRAAKYGNKTVFRYLDKSINQYISISWSELIEQTYTVSRALLIMGFDAEDRIGIFSDNCPQWCISDLGILNIRGIVVPFFGNATTTQVKYIADETQMKLLFAGNTEQMEKAIWLLDNSNFLKKVVCFNAVPPSSDKRLMSWENFCNQGKGPDQQHSLEKLLSESQSTDLATIIYTSGTTGEPKGVMLNHQCFMQAMVNHDIRLRIDDTDESLCFLPLSHVFERTWTYYLIHRGATNTFLENPREVIDVLAVVKPTVMCAVPRFFEKTYEGIIKETMKWSSFKKKIFSWAINAGLNYIEYQSNALSVPFRLKLKRKIADILVYSKLRKVLGGKIKVMPCAGAAINPDILRFFHAAGIFINYGYGATETTATVSCFKTDRYDFDTAGTVMPGVTVNISDDGEILISGGTVFHGYYLKPEETAKSLKDGWYYSGDKGYLTPANNLVMTDRIKDMFKTSASLYVSPQKIEMLLSNDEFIEQLIVIGDNRKYVTALIVPSIEKLERYHQEKGIIVNGYEQMLASQTVYDFLMQRITLLQQEHAPYERIVRFTLLTEPFSVENGAMTSTLKIRRRYIFEKYRDIIEAMYK